MFGGQSRDRGGDMRCYTGEGDERLVGETAEHHGAELPAEATSLDWCDPALACAVRYPATLYSIGM